MNASTPNTGLSISRGTWIARLDADDLCEPERLEKQVRFAKEHQDLGLVGSGFLEIDDNGVLMEVAQ